jgi:mannose-6-phosphate isomerase-like protein (cupin superfamily)
MMRSSTILAVAVTSALAPVAACREGPRSGETQIQSAEVVPDPTKSADTGKGKELKSAKGLVQNIERATADNGDFRRVLYTAPHSQLVVMALPAGEHIGTEVHDVDQFFRIEEGTGDVMIEETRTAVGPGSAIVIPAGTKHDLVNTGAVPLKLYTLYAPPQHRDGVIHHTRADAEKDKEHFDGKTTK